MAGKNKLSFHHKVLFSLLALCWALVLVFTLFQYRREKTFRAELMNMELQMHNERIIGDMEKSADIDSLISRFNKKKKEVMNDTLFRTILSTENPADVWPLLRVYINEKQKMFLSFGAEVYRDVINGFINDKGKMLSAAEKALVTEKDVLKGQRRKLTLCLRKASPGTAMEKSAWFHLSNNMAMSITYNLRRINEVCKEHVDNNFTPLPARFHDSLSEISSAICSVFTDAIPLIDENKPEAIDALRKRCEGIKQILSVNSRDVYDYLQNGEASDMTVAYVYVNLLQESQELVTSLRKMLRAAGKLNLEPSHYRSFYHNTIEGLAGR